MAKTATVMARVEPEVKAQAEELLSQLGVPMSSAVDMFLRQVIVHRGLPFEVQLPVDAAMPSNVEGIIVGDGLTREQLRAEIYKGIEDIDAGRFYTEEEMARKLEDDLESELGL